MSCVSALAGSTGTLSAVFTFLGTALFPFLGGRATSLLSGAVEGEISEGPGRIAGAVEGGIAGAVEGPGRIAGAVEGGIAGAVEGPGRIAGAVDGGIAGAAEVLSAAGTVALACHNAHRSKPAGVAVGPIATQPLQSRAQMHTAAHARRHSSFRKAAIAMATKFLGDDALD
jgi:hypothetical protein